VSGRGTNTGTRYQARVAAYIGAHVIAGKPLPKWFRRALPAPAVVLHEQGGPGDDIRVLLADDTPIEIQAKRGLTKLKELGTCIGRFVAELEPNELGLLTLDRTSSTRISQHLRDALVRWADGMDLVVDPELEEHVAPLRTAAGLTLRGRFAIVEIHVADHDSPDTIVAELVLGALVSDRAEAAFRVLADDAHEAAGRGTRRDRAGYVRELGAAGIVVAQPAAVLVPAQPPVEAPVTPLSPEIEAVNILLKRHQSAAALHLVEAHASRPTDALGAARLQTARAAALLQLGQVAEAKQILQSVHTARSDYVPAIVRLIVAHHNAGEHNEAAALARSTVAAAPSDPSAWATLLHYEDAASLDLVPESLREHPDVLTALAVRRLRSGSPAEAVRLLERASGAEPDDVDRRFLLAQALFGVAEGDPGGAITLERALRLVASVVDVLAEADSTLRDAATIFAARIAQKLERDEETRRWLQRAQRLPRMRLGATLQLAQLELRDGGDPRRALSMLEELDGADSDPMLLSLKARTRARLGDAAGALADLNRAVAIVSERGDAEPVETAIMIASAAIDLERPALAVDLLDGLPPGAADVRVIVLGARARAAAGDTVAATREFERALLAATAADAPKLRYEFAHHLRRAGDDGAAISVLRVDPGPEATQFLVWLLRGRGENTEAERYARPFAEGEPPAPWAIRAMGDAAGARGDDASVADWMRRWMEVEPGADSFINYATVLARLERHEEARAVLERVDHAALQPVERLRMAGLVAHVGDRERSLAIGYSALHTAPHDDQVQLMWIQLRALRDRGGDRPVPTEAAAGVFVLLDRGRGERQGVLLADGPTAQPALDELPVDHELAIAVCGKRVGDEVELRPGPAPVRARVLALLDKYAHAFQWATKQYSSLHPTSAAFQAFSVVNEAGEHDFSALFAQARERHQHVEQLRAVYDQHRTTPLGLIAEATDTSVVDAYDLMWHRERPRVWVEAPDFRTYDGEGIPAKLLLSATALRTIQILRLTPLLDQLSVELCVTPSATIWLRAERQRLTEGTGTGLRSLGWDQAVGRPITRELTPDAVAEALHEQTMFVEWVGARCSVVHRPADWMRERVGNWEMLDLWSFEALLAARDASAVLVADDFGHRYLGWAAWRLPSVTMCGLLGLALSAGRIEQSAFDRDVCRLHMLGHWFVSLSISQLSTTITESDGRVTPQYRQLLRHLSDPEVTMESSARLTAAALRDLGAIISSFATAQAIEATLEAYFAQRPRERARRALYGAIRARFQLVPFDERRMLALVDAFLRARL
jgi:tetratricopeptide (TPR) repeat protein